MKRFFAGFGLLTICLLLVSLSGEFRQDGKISNAKSVEQDLKSAAILKTDPNFANIPLYFIPNRGQADGEALFYAKTSRYTLWLTKEGLVFDAFQKEGRQASELVFLNANKNAEVAACESTEHRVNYFTGNDPSQWQTDIPTSKAVLYKNIYKNVDPKVYGIERQIEYDWVVRTGGKPEDIRFEYRDVERTRIDGKGNLIIEGKFGELKHRKPISYQMKDGRRVEVGAFFKRIGHDEYGFSVKDYDSSYDLIIDPLVLVYSTYLGGTSSDYSGEEYSLLSGAIAVDSSGAVYICGDTQSTNFPIKNAYQKKNSGKPDIFVTKVSPTGKALQYSTYLGGSSLDWGKGIAVDGRGAAYITGATTSKNFPAKNAYQNTNSGGLDAFITKLSPTGKAIEYSTYLGGTNSDGSEGIAVDSKGAVYVIGSTWSVNFPIKNACQKKNRGKLDAFVTKLAPAGQSLEYSTYLGGADSDVGYGIAVDSKGTAYIGGATHSANFPTKYAYQKTFGGGMEDAFAAKLTSSGKGLVYSTYLGGSSMDWGYSIAVNSDGAAHVTGVTYSTNFPTKNAFQKTYCGKADGFVTKLASSGQALEYSTFLGGTNADYGGGIAVDSNGAACVTGGTESKNFPIKNAYQKANRGKYDVYITKFSLNGQTLEYSTYLGGSDDDFGTKVALDSSGAAYVTGGTLSTNFPLKDAFQKTNRGSFDALVAKFSFPSKSAASKNDR